MTATQDSSQLPERDHFVRLTRSLATLDAILCPEWEGRYYSCNSQWSDGTMMASMRNGSGDHWFANPTTEPVRILAVSAGRYPDVVAYPEQGHAWVATREPGREPEGSDKGIIARFDLPPDD